ncbi:MAG: histidine kinase, partial [Ignavibacteriae bacterium]
MIHYAHIAIISVLFLLFLHIPAFPQYDEVKFEHITIENGLPENSVQCMLQDHLGYLWFGTQNGLAKYDGYNMTVYQPNPNDSLSISHQQITVIYEDKTGTLWIGTGRDDFGGVNKFDRTTESFTSYLYNPDDPKSINSNFVTSIYEDKAGNFWVGPAEGLNLFD